MRKRLKTRLLEGGEAKDLAVYSSFDIVGNIAIARLPEPFSTEAAHAAANEIMRVSKGVSTVLAQTSKVEGDYRLRGLICIGGEAKTCTVHKENGCSFAVNVETCYFSPRLAGERLRISKLVEAGETVVNMFAGIGCFSVIIAKMAPTARVYSIDINPEAFAFMQENIRRNRVFPRVVPLLGDANELIQLQLCGVADRVLMPLPEKAFEYLPAAVKALKPSGGWVHVHVFERAPHVSSAKEAAKAEIASALNSSVVGFEFGLVREVRSVGPSRFHIVADVHIFPSLQCPINEKSQFHLLKT